MGTSGAALSQNIPNLVKHSKEGSYPAAWDSYTGYHGERDVWLENLKHDGKIEKCFPSCASPRPSASPEAYGPPSPPATPTVTAPASSPSESSFWWPSMLQHWYTGSPKTSTNRE